MAKAKATSKPTSKPTAKVTAKSKAAKSSKVKLKRKPGRPSKKDLAAEAAFQTLATLAQKRPDELAELAPDQLAKLRTNEQHVAAARLLFEVGTDDAIDLAVDLVSGGRGHFESDLATFDPALRLAIWQRVVARVEYVDFRSEAVCDGLAIADALTCSDLPDDMRQALAVRVVEVSRDSDSRTQKLAIETLWTLGGGTLRDRLVAGDDSIAYDTRVRILMAADPAVAYEQLVADFRGDAELRDVILEMLDARADPRWAHEVLALAESAPSVYADALVQLRAADELCDLAVRPDLDALARCALHALGKLGDPRASQLLVDWLKTPIGQDCAPMLLVALGQCGDPEAAEYLEKQLEHAGSRKAFYQMALAEIRERYESAS